MKAKSIFLLLLLIGLEASAQDSLKFISATTGAACYQVEYHNNHLFAGTGTTLRVYDASASPPYPLLFEYRFRSIVLDLKVRGHFLYVAANHDGISKWDVSIPSNPVKLYEYVPDSLDEAAHDLAFFGDTLFVAYYKKVGVFYDNGASFRKLATFGHLTGNGYIAGGEVKDGIYAYTVARNTRAGPSPDGVYFRNARTFSFISRYLQTFAAPEDVVFGKNTPLLHVLGGTQSTYNPLDPRGLFYSLDVSNLNAPRLAFVDTLTDAVAGLAIAAPLNAVNVNDTIYVATNAALEIDWKFPNPANGHVYVYDATNPSAISFLTDIYAGLWHFDVDVNENLLYVASEWYGIKTLDLTDVFNEVDLGNTLTGGWAMKGDKYGNTLILANEGYGFKKFDISNIGRPVLAGAATYTANAPGFCQEVKFSADGNHIYGLFQTYEQFRIYDANTLALSGFIRNIGGVSYGNTDMLIWGNKVFVDAGTGGNESLLVIDVSNPAAPFIATTMQMNVNDMKMDGSGKLFSCNNDGIYVYDVTTGAPDLLASHVFSAGIQNGEQIAVSNDTIFAYVTWKGLVRYIYNRTSNIISEDVAVPLTYGEPRAMAVDSFGLYLAWTEFGLYAFDKRTLAQSSWYRTGLDLKGYSDNWPVTDLFCKDNLIFLVEYFGQATILSNDNDLVVSAEEHSPRAQGERLTFELAQNFPNPFNPSTTIRFSLSAREWVTLKVFDVNGREVATLVEGKMAAGVHNVTFAPRDLAGGLYFYQLTAGKFSQTRRAVLMK
jgi:hypothetical protein